MYKISEYSNKIIHLPTGEVFFQDDRDERYLSYLVWLKNGNTPEKFYFFEGEEEEMNTQNYIAKLQSVAAELRIKAKAAAIGKTGTSEYIFSQVELYELKFKVASGVIVNNYITSLIENEAVEFGLPIQDFKDLIIHMYTTAKEKYEIFLFMIERCRTKIQTLIELTDFEKVEMAFTYINNLSNASQAEQTMTNILLL